MTGTTLALRSPAGRWSLAAAVLGSGAIFLESTVATVALPALDREFSLGFAGLQWVMNAYLLPLSALILLGGSLGDRYPRNRIFAIGLIGFSAASALCALAGNTAMLMAARVAQGTFGALAVPSSLALLDELFAEADRGAAIGQWAGWSSVSSALGPLLGGWLIDAASWRWVFAGVVPFALAAALIALRRVPRVTSRAGPRPAGALDYPGALLATVSLGCMTAALVTAPRTGLTAEVLGAGALAVAGAVGFVVLERRARDPLLPLGLFRSRQFSGINTVTLLVYTALGSFFFLYILMVQEVLGYGALKAGASMLPSNVVMLALSGFMGRLSTRIGARIPMTVGAAVAAIGFLLLADIDEGSEYLTGILPALMVFAIGLTTLVAPLTSAVLGAVPDGEEGVASAVNNAAARLAGLLGTAVLPVAAGLGGLGASAGPGFAAGYHRAMLIAAGLCVAGAVVTWLTVRKSARVAPAPHPHHSHASGRRRATAPP